MGKGQFFDALRAHKMLILLNFAQKSLFCNPPPAGAFRRIFTHGQEGSMKVEQIIGQQVYQCKFSKSGISSVW